LRTDTCFVRVIIKENGISLNKDTLYLTVGESSGALLATVIPDSATDKEVTWFSYSSVVATVNNGVVKAVSAGETLITALTKNIGKTATCLVIVADTANAIAGTELHTVSLYPNPAADEVFLKGSNGCNLVEVFTLTGSLIFRQNNITVIPIGSWENGIYLIRITCGGRVSEQRVMKMK